MGHDVGAQGDRLAARYMLAVLDRDAEAQLLALAEVRNGPDLWDLVDALGAACRDVLDEPHEADRARCALRRRLLDAAVRDAGGVP